MKSTLSELWHGNIRPQSEIPENDQKNQELRRNLDLSYDILWNKLDDDGKQILDQLQTYHTELSLTQKEESFIQGFSLAVKMMTEALGSIK